MARHHHAASAGGAATQDGTEVQPDRSRHPARRGRRRIPASSPSEVGRCDGSARARPAVPRCASAMSRLRSTCRRRTLCAQRAVRGGEATVVVPTAAGPHFGARRPASKASTADPLDLLAAESGGGAGLTFRGATPCRSACQHDSARWSRIASAPAKSRAVELLTPPISASISASAPPSPAPPASSRARPRR